MRPRERCWGSSAGTGGPEPPRLWRGAGLGRIDLGDKEEKALVGPDMLVKPFRRRHHRLAVPLDLSFAAEGHREGRGLLTLRFPPRLLY